jgi:hypothetical protein
LEASRRNRRGESLPPFPAEAPISFTQAAERGGISTSTLHEWRRRKYFPEPKHHNRARWFTEHQVSLLKSLKELLRVYGKRRGKVKFEQLKEAVTSIGTNWD